MNALLALLKMRFKIALQYRVAALAGVFTQIFFGLFKIMVFEALFFSTVKIMPMNYQETVTYIWLGQALLWLLPWNGDQEIQGMIRTGDFAYELVRPLNLYNYWFVRILATRLAGTVLRILPVLVVAFCLLPEEYCMQLPPGSAAFGYFALSLIFAVLLGCAISNLITISVLFTIGDGVERLLPACMMIFTGMVIPLSFFPDWSQLIFKILPFSGLVDTPYKFYLGIYGREELIFTLLHQSGWIILLVALGKYLISRAQKRIVVQGG